MDLRLHVRSQPFLSLRNTRQPAPPPELLLRLRLWEARAPINLSPSGDLSSFQDMEIRLDREFRFTNLYAFMSPGKAKRVVASMLSACRSVWPVGEGDLAVLVQQVCGDFTYSGAKAMSMAPCDVTGMVEILRVPASYETGPSGGGQIGRALLESREDHERQYWGSFGGVPASEAAIEKLETAAYPGPKGEESRCVVCYEEFAPPGEVKKMPCGHVFHGKCIVQWLRRSHRCPLCRFEMPKAEEAAPPS